MINEEKHNDLIKFEDGSFSLDVKVSPNEDTVWLTIRDISKLFERDISVIGKHIRGILKKGELDNSTVAFFATVQTEGTRSVIRNVSYYNLDMIMSVGYRVNSKRGIQFRKRASSLLKQYLLNGYVVNSDMVVAYESKQLKLEFHCILKL